MLHRLACVLALAGVLIGGGATSLAAPNLPPPRYVAKADAYVSAASARQNFGGAAVLEVRGRPASRAYLSFDLRGVGTGAIISKATLRLQSRSPRGRFSVRAARNGWTERGITFRNAPPPGRLIANAVRARLGLVRANVKSGVSPGRTVSFVLTAPRGVIRFASRESNGAPRLDLVLEPTGTAGGSAR